jgi:hypothetical protein
VFELEEPCDPLLTIRADTHKRNADDGRDEFARSAVPELNDCDACSRAGFFVVDRSGIRC